MCTYVLKTSIYAGLNPYVFMRNNSTANKLTHICSCVNIYVVYVTHMALDDIPTMVAQ